MNSRSSFALRGLVLGCLLPCASTALAEGPETSIPESAPPRASEQAPQTAPEGSAQAASEAPVTASDAPPPHEEAKASTTAAPDPGPTPPPRDAQAARVKPAPVAPAVVEPPPPDPNTLPFTYHEKHLDLQFSVGSAWFASDSIDPFASQDAMAIFSGRIGAFPFRVQRWAFGLLAEGTYGSMGGTARQSQTSLEMGSLGVGLEARYHFHHRYYALARVTPGASNLQASLTATGNEPLADDNWGFTLGGRLGAGARIWGPDDGSVRAPRGFLVLEGGYRFSPEQALALVPPSDSPLDAEPWEPSPISLSGFELALALALTY